MPYYTRRISLWLLLYVLLTGCTPGVELAIAGTWAVCHDGRNDGSTVFGGLVYEEIVRFYEDGTFHIYPKNTYLRDGTNAQTSGEYQLLTVESAATSAHGDIQLTLTTPAPMAFGPLEAINVRVPYTYLPPLSERDGLLLLATDSDLFPCQPCLLCQVTLVTERAD